MPNKIEKPVVITLDSKTEYSNEYMSLQSESLLLIKEENGIVKQLNKEYYSINCPNFVVGIVIKDNKLLVVNQYRHPVGDMNMEFVAGMIEKDESPRKAIIKELKEEAGIVPKSIKLLGKCRPLSGQNKNYCFVYLITDFSFSERNLEEYEDFTNLSIQWISIKSFKRMIKSNRLQDGVTLMSWALYSESIK
jgi:ADP-ribose pyrophosphatase